MDFPVNLKVNFRGNAKSFLVSYSESSWESLEAMIQRSFGLCSLQVTYFDEDNEEVSINSQEEYEEALKCALKHGNRLHMNVCEMKGPPGRGPAKPKSEGRPSQHCPALTKTVSQRVHSASQEQATAVMKELKGTKEEDKTPPAWFTSYMEKFKDQVVKEAVEKICREFSGQCCIHKPVGADAQVPEVSSSSSAGVPSSTPACSSCQGQTSGGGYQCSVCTSCTLCEPCSLAHDPSHSLVRARTPLSIPEHGSPGPEHARFQRRGDRSFRKAEKQRLKAEKRQLKAEVKEIRKQLRMERRGLQWSAGGEGSTAPILLQPRATQTCCIDSPNRSCPPMGPVMTALFLDENLPDGTRLQPGTKFIKYWKMRNTGSLCWSTETKLKFMWGNLTVASSEKQKEVAVPFLQPGQVGVVSVAFTAPAAEGTYTSHWRLAHQGEQFGPRVWCSIVVDPLAPAGAADSMLDSPCGTPQVPLQKKEAPPLEKEGPRCPAPRDCGLMSLGLDCEQEYYIPSVDLLTAQDLLSFELLDINIVQELESVPNNTPADMTPCMSPLPHDGPLLEKPGLGQIEEEAETSGARSLPDAMRGERKELGSVPAQEEGEEDISGTQFVCETVIRSLTLEEEPEHTPLRRPRPSHPKGCFPASQDTSSHGEKCEKSVGPAVDTELRNVEAPPPVTPQVTHEEQSVPEEGVESDIESICVDPSGEEEEGPAAAAAEGGAAGDERDEVRSQASSASSEDYIIILPDCFDTSRPLGESMYSSALSHAGAEGEGERDEGAPRGRGSISDMLCTSQTLDAVPLTPVVVPAPPLARRRCYPRRPERLGDMELTAEVLDTSELYQPEDTADSSSPVRSQPTSPSEASDSGPQTSQDSRPQGGITDGLVKGALSVAASAYKALFTGQPGNTQPPTDSATQEAMMAVLLEMGFGDRPLNQRLLKKHGYNLLDVVNELVQMADNDWFVTRY
ncbi:next to BRCA1 gene 1 protein-like isoform X1 [Megalops cyprinoides]|uniref:next to BRCA1 gene 1 protein-like isoform X1 n=1 Tax=Megalops cyprinoides TaxID=118141 RepID=UPI00186496AD|nr:next to BRCA1 gene 1 protein-like isoform X1 [Megalops cyprinoides]